MLFERTKLIPDDDHAVEEVVVALLGGALLPMVDVESYLVNEEVLNDGELDVQYLKVWAVLNHRPNRMFRLNGWVQPEILRTTMPRFFSRSAR